MLRFLKIISIALFSLLLLLFVVVQFFGDQLGRSVITGLNESLNTEITVGEVEISLLRAFPSLSVDLTDFTMAGSDGSPLLEAKRLSCQIGLSSIFGKTQIKTIIVSDGALQINVDPDGNTNYQLLEYQPVDVQIANQGKTQETAAFAIDDARLENVELIYQNRQLGLDAMALLYDANFQGDFGTEVYDLATQVNAEIRFIDNGDQRILPGQSLRIGANSVVNNAEQSYDFKELYLGIGGLNLLAEGRMQQVSNGWDTDLSLASEEGSLTDLIRLIPEEYLGALGELRSNGKFSLSGKITERWTDARQPKLDFKVAFIEGKLSSARMDLTAKDISFIGQFSNGDLRIPSSSFFNIETLSGQFGRDPFDLSLRVDNLDQPTIAFGANGSFPLEALSGLLPEGLVNDGDGRILVNEVRLSGKVADMMDVRRMGRVKSGGTLAFEDAELEINDRKLEFPGGRLILRDNELEIDNFHLVAPGNDITFTGQATNLIPVLFADSLNTQDAELIFRALLKAEKLDIDELLTLAGPTEEEIEEAENAGQTDSLARKSVARRAQLTDLLNGQFDADVKTWNYGEMQGENFRGQLTFSPKKLQLKGQSDAMDGQFRLEGEMYFVESTRLEARIISEQVDVNEFFRQGENFGQEVLVADNLKGKMDSRIFVRAYFDQSGNLDYNRLLVLAGLGIKDGELTNFGMLESFSAVLKEKDLSRVRFSNLENYLEISDNTVYIPTMFIQSSAMNMTISGSHTFSHLMDYNIKVNVGQVLANKIARHDNNLEVLPARRRGFFNLHYSITGNLENYQYETNKRKVKAAFEQSNGQRDRIRNELERQFKEAIQLVEEPQDWRDVEVSPKKL